MSTQTAPLHKFFVYAPDAPDAYERRMAVREQHLARSAQLVQDGLIRASTPSELHSLHEASLLKSIGTR